MSVPSGEPSRPGPEPAPPRAAAPEPEPPRAAPEPVPQTFLAKAAYVVAPGTAVIGLLYYFGSVYTDNYYAIFGVPSADLQLSVQAYVARSPKAVFAPVWFLLVCGLVALLVLGRIGHFLDRPGNERRRRTVCRWFLVVGLLLAMTGFLFFFVDGMSLPLPASWWVTPHAPTLVVALGATLAFFAVQQRLQQSARERGPERAADQLWSAGGALLIGLLAMSLFYGMTQYVADSGATDAWKSIEAGHAASLPVVVYSRIPVMHDAKGIKYEDMGADKGPYRHRYLGFHLLAKSPSRYYLVSYASRYEDHLTVVLPDDDTVRVALTSPAR